MADLLALELVEKGLDVYKRQGHCNITRGRILDIMDYTDSDLLASFGYDREVFFKGLSSLIVEPGPRQYFLDPVSYTHLPVEMNPDQGAVAVRAAVGNVKHLAAD